MNRALVFAALLASTLIAGCVPYPVYKTLQPSAKATVLTADNAPLAGAEVTLIASAYPYGSERHRNTTETLADGTAHFAALRDMRIEVLMIHGAQEFFWNWCVRKAGYVTYVTAHRDAEQFQAGLVVRLPPGVSTPCPPVRR